MNCVQVENLSKTYGYDPLFSGVTFTLDEGDKVGLIARNGAGKSTLMRILAGEETADAGTIVCRTGLRVGYLPQIPAFDGARTVLEACVSGSEPRAKALRKYENALHNGDNEAITAASELIDSLQAWDYQSRFIQLLDQLKINDFTQTIDTLSGGQLKRVALAKLLMEEPHLLLLDEPTNHLDIDIIEWLEDFLQRSRTTLLMVTHDRYFLDNVCNRILELDRAEIYTYEGNYNYYLEKRTERIEARNAATERARNLLRTELEWMRRQPQARGHKAQYRIDAFYELQEKARRVHEQGDVRLNVKATRIGKKIFEACHVSKAFGDNVILRDFNYTFARYEKLGIVGDNGVGKTTFIRLLLGQLQPDSGHFDIGKTVRFGYYSQEGMHFDEGKTVIDAVSDVAEDIVFDDGTRYSASQFLNLFLFDVPVQQKLIANLSGGEKRRLYLAMTLLAKPNFLILDEPTNDLDISTLEVLENYLEKFHGCVIIVSHDRFFMDRTVDHIFVFSGNGNVKDFPGNYSQWRAWKQVHDAQLAAEKATHKQAAPKREEPRRKNRPEKLSYKERKELEQLASDIEALTAERKQLDSLFASGQVIDGMDLKSARYSEINALLDDKEMRWLELMEKEQ